MASSSSKDQPLSINGILRKHSGARLLVEPLKWTLDQLKHLDISFEEPANPHEPSLGDDIKVFQTVASEDLEERNESLEKLLQKACNSLDVEDNLDFFFQGTSVLSLNCMSLREIGVDYPAAAHIDLEAIRNMKSNKMKSKIRDLSTIKALEISKSKLAKNLSKVTPDNPLFEPLIAAVLIALAQTQQRASLSRPDSKDNQDITQEALKSLATDDKEYTVRVLSNCYKKGCFYLYTAVIPSSCLARFNDPDYVPPKLATIWIKLIDIPFLPLVSLHRRVFNDLFRNAEGTRDSDEPSDSPPSDSSPESDYVSSS